MKLKLILLAVAIAAIAPSAYFYYSWSRAKYRISHPAEAAKVDADKLVNAVAKLMLIPNEAPQIADITSDVAKLASQKFFAEAKDGDKLLVFSKAREAILFRPSIGKIIDVAPFSLSSSLPAASSSPQALPPAARVVIRNGTWTTGAALDYQSVVVSKVPYAAVIGIDNATKRDYQTTILIDLTKTRTRQANDMAQKLGVSISPMPVGEATPEADFLIIIGANEGR